MSPADSMRAERDELLVALKEALTLIPVCPCSLHSGCSAARIRPLVQNVIAKAENR